MRIHEFQEMMRRLYFDRDSKRGIEGTYCRLLDEVEELHEALRIGNMRESEKEFADVVAWLASLANIVGVDLERSALAKYDNRCPKCRHSPCRCNLQV